MSRNSRVLNTLSFDHGEVHVIEIHISTRKIGTYSCGVTFDSILSDIISKGQPAASRNAVQFVCSSF